jgi:hypothetical protein
MQHLYEQQSIPQQCERRQRQRRRQPPRRRSSVLAGLFGIIKLVVGSISRWALFCAAENVNSVNDPLWTDRDHRTFLVWHEIVAATTPKTRENVTRKKKDRSGFFPFPHVSKSNKITNDGRNQTQKMAPSVVSVVARSVWRVARRMPLRRKPPELLLLRRRHLQGGITRHRAPPLSPAVNHLSMEKESAFFGGASGRAVSSIVVVATGRRPGDRRRFPKDMAPVPCAQQPTTSR